MILGSNSKIILNTSSLVNTTIHNNQIICPRGCKGYNNIQEGSTSCSSCGLVLKQEDLVPESFGGIGFDFQSNKRQETAYGSSSSNGINQENRQREISKQISEFCTQYTLNLNEREEVGQIVEAMLHIMDEKKKKCRSLKSLVAACFYEYNKKLHKSIPINQMCKHFMIKQRKLLKYTKKLSKYQIQIKSGSITHSERIRNEWDEVMNTVTDKIKCFLLTGNSSSIYNTTYKPEVSNFAFGQGLNLLGLEQNLNEITACNIAYKQQIKDIELNQTAKKIEMIKQKIKALYNCEYLSVTRMGKHPTNYICTLMYVILKSMNIEFRNNKFCDQVGIKYSTLSREKKEIMQYLCNSLIISPPLTPIPPRIQSVLTQLNQDSASKQESPSFTNKLSGDFIAYTLEHVISINSNCMQNEDENHSTSSAPVEVSQINQSTVCDSLLLQAINDKNSMGLIDSVIVTPDTQINKPKRINLDDSFSFESCPSSQQQSPIRRQVQATSLNQLSSSSSSSSDSSCSSSRNNTSSPSSVGNSEDEHEDAKASISSAVAKAKKQPNLKIEHFTQ
ncbi:hypothetical protein ABPG72_010642 [Tetrahymena utriculariae]